MPRKQFIIDPTAIYNIGGRCRNRDWFDLPMENVWTIMENHLHFLFYGFGIEILSFVLMTNHFHLMLRSPLGNLSEAMHYFMSETSRDFRRESKRINQIWGSRFYRCRLIDYWSVNNCYKYNYRNPVTAGMCERVEDYPFSSLHGLLGKSIISFPISIDTLLSDDLEETLKWLNATPEMTAEDSIRRALRRRDFQLPKINDRLNPWLTKRI